MATTVSSLEERVDAIADDVTTTRIKLNGVAEDVALTKIKVEAMYNSMNELRIDFAAFKSKADFAMSLAKWTAGIVMTVAIAALFQAFTVARDAGRLESSVGQLREVVAEQKTTVQSLEATLRRSDSAGQPQKIEAAEQSKLLREIAQSLAELKAAGKPKP